MYVFRNESVSWCPCCCLFMQLLVWLCCVSVDFRRGSYIRRRFPSVYRNILRGTCWNFRDVHGPCSRIHVSSIDKFQFRAFIPIFERASYEFMQTREVVIWLAEVPSVTRGELFLQYWKTVYMYICVLQLPRPLPVHLNRWMLHIGKLYVYLRSWASETITSAPGSVNDPYWKTVCKSAFLGFRDHCQRTWIGEWSILENCMCISVLEFPRPLPVYLNRWMLYIGKLYVYLRSWVSETIASAPESVNIECSTGKGAKTCMLQVSS